MLKRLLLLVVSTLALALAAEGVLSLCFHRSLSELWRGRDDTLENIVAQRLALEKALTEEAGKTSGPYRVDEDPYVGYSFKREAEVEYFEKRVHTDALGLRARPGPPPAPNAFRVVLLGDSVAFGHGLDDDQTIAAQLESVLRDVRAPDALPVACATVAVPSWNYRNCVRFLLDHLDELAPHVVLYMDIDNDLDDSYTANEVGQRILMEDPGSPDPLLNFRANPAFFNHSVFRLREQGRALDPQHFGPQSHQAGLSESSRWRIEDMAHSLTMLNEVLAARGARLALLPYVQHPTHRQVRARLARAKADLPSIPLFEDIRDADMLQPDPHPNAGTVRTFAVWTAATLLQWGWVPGKAVRELPAVAEEQRGRRTEELSGADVQAWSARFEEEARAKLERRISADTLQGMLQIYGGLNVDGTFGPRLAAVLPAGRTLHVELAPYPERPDLYPLQIDVAVDGAKLGTFILDSANLGTLERDFELPESAAGRPFEVQLSSPRWCLHKLLVVSATFVAFESRE